jgi:NADPH:quinone reductase
MRVIKLKGITKDYSGIEVVEQQRPTPEKGEILIKINCAPINPSDLMMLQGDYIIEKQAPFVPGIVAVGEVIENNAGLLGHLMMSQRVAFTPVEGKNGTWAEYAISTPKLCVPLKGRLADENAVNLLSNAATAIGLLETIRKAKSSSVVITAAASEVGQMLNTIAPRYKISTINIVRTSEQEHTVRQAGAIHVLNMTTETFQQDLSSLTHKLNARIAIDAIAGEMPNILMNTMPDHSMIVILGRLSGEDLRFDGLKQLVGKQHTLKGFSINEWFLNKSLIGQVRAGLKAQHLLLNGYTPHIQHRVSLDEAAQNMYELTRSQSKGKTVIYPSKKR